MSSIWPSHYAHRTTHQTRSIIRELLKFSVKPGIISFAGGLPAPELFPTERIQDAACRLLSEQGSVALQYGESEGYLPLRKFICEQMARSGVQVGTDNVLIVHGSQQALDLVGKVLIDPDDRIVVEEPTYLGAFQAWNCYEAAYIGVAADDAGMCTDRLDAAVAQDPKAIYILPNFQNPGGSTLPLDRRLELLRVSREFGIPIIEDDPYGELRFEGEPLPSLFALDAQQRGQRLDERGMMTEGNVIYLGTFSKTLAPGLRLGWIVAPLDVMDQCIIAKQGADLHTSTFTQMLTYEVVRDGFLDEHVQTIRRVYGERRKVMTGALERYFPEGCSWTAPHGGLFLLARLPEGLDAAELLPKAVAHGVAYVPGFAFYADHTRGRNVMRLNFSNARPEMIEEGIRRLAEMVKEELATREPVFAVAG